jgi:hypothetical protein
VLAERVAEGDLYDVAFRCGACGGLSMGACLPAGRPLPWQKTVAVPPGNYRIVGTVEGREGVVLAASEAVDRALREIGSPIGVSLGQNADLDADFLDSLVARTKAVLGDAYLDLASLHQRGRRESRTPPKRPHRLMELMDAAEAAAATFRAGAPAIDPLATVELHGMLQQLDRWRNHPSWPRLLPSLKNPEDFPHVAVTLAAASFLSDMGNGVELVPAGDTRSPDLRLHLGARSAVSTEVKAPLALQRPATPIDTSTAAEILERAFKKAGTGVGGQLAPGADAVLVLGGFALRNADLAALQSAARELLRRYPEERKHVLGVAIVWLGALVDSRPAGVVGRTLPTLSGTIDSRIALNENYSGPNRISQEQRPGMEPLEQLKEIELKAGQVLEMSAAPGTGHPNRAERRAAARGGRHRR